MLWLNADSAQETKRRWNLTPGAVKALARYGAPIRAIGNGHGRRYYCDPCELDEWLRSQPVVAPERGALTPEATTPTSRGTGLLSRTSRGTAARDRNTSRDGE